MKILTAQDLRKHKKGFEKVCEKYFEDFSEKFFEVFQETSDKNIEKKTNFRELIIDDVRAALEKDDKMTKILTADEWKEFSSAASADMVKAMEKAESSIHVKFDLDRFIHGDPAYCGNEKGIFVGDPALCPEDIMVRFENGDTIRYSLTQMIQIGWTMSPMERVPFDLERFKAGEPAYCRGEEIHFSRTCDDGLLVMTSVLGIGFIDLSVPTRKGWTMLPIESKQPSYVGKIVSGTLGKIPMAELSPVPTEDVLPILSSRMMQSKQYKLIHINGNILDNRAENLRFVECGKGEAPSPAGAIGIGGCARNNGMNFSEAIQSSMTFQDSVKHRLAHLDALHLLSKQSTKEEERILIEDGLLDPWHEHTGAICPIPWALKNEWSIRGLVVTNCDTANDAYWPIQCEFRLTNGWLYVKGDGSIPEGIKGAKAGEWELRFRDGHITAKLADASLVIAASWKHSGAFNDIVAVRRIVPEQDGKSLNDLRYVDNSAQSCKGKNCGSIDGKWHSKECIAEHEACIDGTTLNAKQQLNREAYERYMSGFPAKEPFRPLGETGINEAAAMAVRDHKL